MSISNKTIYLCGPIAGRTDAECTTWRIRAKELWPGKCLDPMRHDYRAKLREARNDKRRLRELSREIVIADLQDIASSDGLLVYFDKPSVGTAQEIVYAWSGYSLGAVKHRPIVVVNRSPEPLSPWLIYHSSEVVPSLDDALATMSVLLRQR